MKTETTVTQALRLCPISGPDLRMLEIDTEGAVLGRSVSCDVVLGHDSVSRRHASITRQGERWIVSDLASRHGTVVNAQELTANTPMPLAHRDVVRIGPWTFRVETERDASTVLPTTDDRMVATQRVETVSKANAARLAQHRLDSLIDCAAMITGASDEQALAEGVLKAALEGTGFHRAALIRQLGAGEQVEILGYRSSDGAASSEVSFSRSLLREAAAKDQMVRLASDEVPSLGVSIIQLGIASAVCAPIHVGQTIDSFLYLDARHGEQMAEADATGYCQVVVRICGLALANLRRLQLETRQRQLVSEIEAARTAQTLIVPAEEGTEGQLRYAHRMLPGSLVAGDLFDVVPLAEGRIAVCIGDVAGEGVGAAVIMTATQSHLHALLTHRVEPAEAVTEVNRYIANRSAMDKFVSLWLGIFDLDRGVLSYVDAGHGHWLMKRAGERPQKIPHRGGIPLGIEPGYGYHSEEMPIGPGDRVILYSDGVIEQQSGSGATRFGQDRLIDVLAETKGPVEDVATVLGAVRAFAEHDELADDTTVASIEVASPDDDSTWIE